MPQICFRVVVDNILHIPCLDLVHPNYLIDFIRDTVLCMQCFYQLQPIWQLLIADQMKAWNHLCAGLPTIRLHIYVCTYTQIKLNVV